MIIKSSAGTEIAKNGYTVIDELNQIPMIKTNYLQLEHNHINPIIIGSKAFEYKDIFVNVVEDTETSGDTAFKEYNAIHEFAWILSGMRKHDSYTGYLSLEQYLTMVLEGTDFTYQVEGGHQYYALQFENLGDGESHLDMFFKMLNRWNTEFELRGKKVYITHQRGRIRDKHVGRYKMNIIDTVINSDITDGATAVWGYFGKKDEENPENSTYREFYWQIDELVEQYGIRYAKPYSNENITQEETMIEYLNNIILDSWKISTKVDIAEITDEVAQTGDEYVAVDERLGITLNTRIQKLESVYDADDKLLYQTATLGTVSFASAASGSSSQLQEVIEKVKKDYNDRITDLKQEFDNRFNDEVTQIEIDFNELVNGVRQEIQADYDAMSNDFEQMKLEQQQRVSEIYEDIGSINQTVSDVANKANYLDGVYTDLSTQTGEVTSTVANIIDGKAPAGSVLRQTTDSVLNRVWEQDIANIEVGDRNLLKDSGRYIKNSDYNIARYYLSEDLKEGEEVTIQLKGRLAPDRNRFAIYNSGGLIQPTSLYPSDVKAKRNLAINSEIRSDYTSHNGDFARIQYDLAYNTEIGKTYTVSFDIVGSLVHSDAVTVNNFISADNISQSFYAQLSGTRGVVTFTARHSGDKILIYKGKAGNTSENYDRTIYIKNVMVVEGAEEAPWSPAWEDEVPIFEKTFNWTNSRIYNGVVTAPVGQWVNIYQMNSANTGESEIEWVKLVRGKQISGGYTPAPEDNLKYTDLVMKSDSFMLGSFELGGDKIAQAILGKAGAIDLIADNVNLSNNLNVANQIKSLSLETVYANISEVRTRMLVADAITANMVKFDTALIEKFTSSTAFINSLTAKTAFINNIKAIDINSENIRVGFNKIAGSLQITPTGLEIYNGKNKTMQLDDRGSTFWSGTRLIGRIGSSYLTNDNTVKTLRFALDDSDSMMSWEYKVNSTDTDYQMMLQYSPKVQNGHDKRGFIFNDDVSIVPSRVLQLSYIRPLNYTDTGNRIYLSTWTWRGTRGVGMVGGNVDGSGVWFGNNQVALFANTSGKAGQGELDIASDSRSYFIRSETIHDRDYGNSANVCITSNGVLGRATSARKYKEFIELQHETEEKQLEHSKKILQLKPKTWYSKSLLEAVAKEIETGEVDSVDDFKIERQFGMIADEFEEVGLTELVQYGKDDEVEGLSYDRIPVHHNVLIKDLYDENDTLKDRINDLENKLNKIMEMMK